MRRLVVIAVLVLLAAPSFAAPPQTLADVVKADQGIRLSLRGFYSDDALHYDASGNVLGNPEHGLWPLDGTVEIASAEFGATSVKLKCVRYWALFEGPTGQKRTLAPVRRRVEIEVDTVAGDDSVVKFKAALKKVFLSGKEELYDIAVPLWQPYLAAPEDPRVTRFRKNYQAAGQPATAAKPAEPEAPPESKKTGGALSRPVYLSAAEADARLIHSVDPDYPDSARAVRLYGTVVLGVTVSPTGEPLDIYVLKPAGGGMDEAAAEAVRMWKYKPYSVGGSTVYFDTEVKFEFKAPGQFKLRLPKVKRDE
jgi:TonB family protein